jgi:hypothetical protein
MEVIGSSETPVHIPTTRRFITEDGNIHNYRCENFKPKFLCSNFATNLDFLSLDSSNELWPVILGISSQHCLITKPMCTTISFTLQKAVGK